MAGLPQSSTSGLHFTLLTPNTARKFGPRIGNVALRRPNGIELKIETPGLLTSTSRGVIPHLSRDHHNLTEAIRWVHIPFETFLEQSPPVPTLQTGKNPLHKFLGYSPSQHILSMSIRDPNDGREMPTNGNAHVSAYSLRGVRKISPSSWRSHITACQPDIAIALSDTPFTNPPYSQKRLTKSIERSAGWLADILHPAEEPSGRPNIFVHMSGATSIPARRAFAESLTETLHGKEADVIKPFRCLDECVSGYTFDLVPLYKSLGTSSNATNPSHSMLTKTTSHIDQVILLLQASLTPLTTPKLRLVNSTRSPHDVLRLIQYVGVDVFDVHWAQQAADIGVALDFSFPALKNEKQDIGHNLYHTDYAFDFSALAQGTHTNVAGNDKNKGNNTCVCVACSPMAPSTRITHGSDLSENSIQAQDGEISQYRPSYTRAYLHHLLHTHEMSAHSLLVMHNLSVLDTFFANVREVLQKKGEEVFLQEVEIFQEAYDGDLIVFDQARIMWKEVEMARGKGRLAREKAKQEESTLGTTVDM